MELKKWPWKKIVILLVIIAVAVGGWYYWKNSLKTQDNLAAKAVVVEKRNLTSSVSATGTIKASDSVDIGSKLSGRVLKVYVQENTYVKQGDTLMELDAEQVKTQVDQTQATLDNASASYERQKRLYNQGAIAAQTLDDAQKTYLVAKANHQTTLSQLNDTVIKAPISGFVIGKPIAEGSTVSAGTANVMVLTTLANLDKMEIETLVDESDIGQVKENMKTTFQVDAFPEKTFTGKVIRISKSSTTSNNVIYYKVTIVVDQPQGLLPGMTARVTIETKKKDDVLAIPLRYVQDQNNKKTVIVLLTDNTTESRIVTTGFASDEYIEITSGLKEGEKVVSPASTKSGSSGTRVPRL